MKVIIVGITVVLCLSVLVNGQGTTCTNGRVYEVCGTACPLTCANKDSPPAGCIQMCVSGCFCPTGLVAYNEGCLPPDQCPNETNNYGAPYVEPTLQCPDANGVTGFGACVIEEPCRANGNGDCGAGRMCCSNGCGIICVNGSIPDPLCSSVRQKALNSSLLGAYIPQCNNNGHFSRLQCHEGYCWCVNSHTGKALNLQSRNLTSCDVATVPSLTPCQIARQKALNSSLLGVYTPKCDANGLYQQMQCHEGFCWCVDVNTGNSSTEKSRDLTSCGVATVPSLTPCQIARQKALNTSLLGVYVPKCDTNGLYQQMQCHEGFCWCVDVNTGNSSTEKSRDLTSCGVAANSTSPAPPACTNGKVHTQCGTACPITCENKDNPPSVCPMICVSGCFCPSGMVQLDDGCVVPDQCPFTPSPSPTASSFSAPNYCSLAYQIGPCKGSFPSYYYNSTTQTCERFIYGGCGGNDNRFNDLTSCLQTCTGIVLELPSVSANLTHIQFCPAVSNDVMGTCSDQCSADDDCEDWEKCCSNGCGHTCATPTAVPYYSPPKKCPPINPLLGIFCSIDFGCKNHEICDEDSLCCPTGCGSKCMKAITPSPLCTAVKNFTMSTGLIGSYIPQCDENGNFSSVQCHGSTGMCWCADSLSGKPLTSPVMFQQPECDSLTLNCQGIECEWPNCGAGVQPITDSKHCCPYCPSSSGSCVMNGTTHANGSSFTAPDGCNTCHCINGMAGCTKMFCSPCVIDGVVHPSGSSFPSSDGCNECHCVNGNAACTERACLLPCVVNGVSHPSGSSYTAPDGCNTCHCDNGVAGCTRMLCAPCVIDGVSHPSGSSFPSSDGCNECHCVNGNAACTERACLLPCVVNGVSHPSGSSYTAPDGCNTCHCYNGLAACTEMLCPPCVVNGVSHPSGTSFKEGCNTCFCSNGHAMCTLMACLPTCSAGGMTIPEGETVNDGCSKCTCTNKNITCTKSASCETPIKRAVNVTMKFSGDFDTVSQNMAGFKQGIKNSLINKYSTSTGLQGAQITDIAVSRGSVIVRIIIEDNDQMTTSANVTHLLILMEQDYRQQQLVIVYQDMVLIPTGNFSYSQSDRDSSEHAASPMFWIYIGVSSLLAILIMALAVVVVVAYVKRRRRYYHFNHHRLPSSDVDQEVTIKGVKNPMFVLTPAKM